MVQACGESTEKVVDSVYKLLNGLKEHNAPTPQAVLKMSEWNRDMMGKCEHYLQTMVPLNPVDPFSDSRMMSGRKAMDYLWNKFSSKPVAERRMEDAQRFRQFAWMLAAQQNAIVDGLVHSGIASYQAEFLKNSICDAPPNPAKSGSGGSKGGAVASGSSGAGSSSSSSSALAKTFVAAASSDTASKPDQLAANKARLLAMFRK